MALTELNPFLTDTDGKQHELQSPVVTVGRAVESAIVITSKRASRLHAKFFRDGQKVFLEDLGSTNGTFVNGVRILSAVELRDGDVIMVGEVELEFHDPDTTTRDVLRGDLQIDLDAGEVRLDRKPVALSPKEIALLSYLHQRRGKVCSKDEIGEAVWPEYQSGVYEYQIENLVRRLRTRIEVDPDVPQHLLTVRGLGYKLV